MAPPEPETASEAEREPGDRADPAAEGKQGSILKPAPASPWFASLRRIPLWTVGAALIVVLLSYALGWSQGRNETSDTKDEQAEAPVTEPGTEPATDDAASTTTAPPMAMPAVATTTLDFAQGLPPGATGAPGPTTGRWEVVDGSAAVVEPVPLDGATEPRRVTKGPHLLVETAGPATLVSAVLRSPTTFSGVVTRYVDDDDYWLLSVDADRTHLSLIQVLDGNQSARGFVDVAVVSGMSIGLLVVDGQIGVVVNGTPQSLNTFFGPMPGISTDGIDGTKVGVIGGDGSPSFDDLTFG